jgi:hypothetical protein
MTPLLTTIPGLYPNAADEEESWHVWLLKSAATWHRIGQWFAAPDSKAMYRELPVPFWSTAITGEYHVLYPDAIWYGAVQLVPLLVAMIQLLFCASVYAI